MNKMSPLPQLPSRAAGWRARLGILVPYSNTATEVEFARLAPDGVSAHTARFRFPAASGGGSYFEGLCRQIEQPLDDLKLCGSDVVALACTSASMNSPLTELTSFMSAKTGKPAVSAADAVLGALRKLGAAKIALASPYVEKTNAEIAAFFARHGITVVASEGLGLNASPEIFRQTARQTAQAVYDLCKRVAVPEAEAVFVACTDLPSLDMIVPFERERGVSVVSGIQACYWAAATAIGIAEPRPGFGRLLEA